MSMVMQETEKLSRNRLAKMEQVEQLRQQMAEAQVIVFVDYRGLNVTQVTDLRNRLRAQNVTFQVVKNTILERAAAANGFEGLDELLKGPTAVAFGFDDPVAPASALSKFAKESKILKLKGGVLDGKAISSSDVQALAELPSREELLAKLLGAMQAPLVGMATVLSAPLRGFATAADALRRQRESEGAA